MAKKIDPDIKKIIDSSLERRVSKTEDDSFGQRYEPQVFDVVARPVTNLVYGSDDLDKELDQLVKTERGLIVRMSMESASIKQKVKALWNYYKNSMFKRYDYDVGIEEIIHDRLQKVEATAIHTEQIVNKLKDVSGNINTYYLQLLEDLRSSDRQMVESRNLRGESLSKIITLDEALRSGDDYAFDDYIDMLKARKINEIQYTDNLLQEVYMGQKKIWNIECIKKLESMQGFITATRAQTMLTLGLARAVIDQNTQISQVIGILPETLLNEMQMDKHYASLTDCSRKYSGVLLPIMKHKIRKFDSMFGRETTEKLFGNQIKGCIDVLEEGQAKYLDTKYIA